MNNKNNFLQLFHFIGRGKVWWLGAANLYVKLLRR